MSVAEKTKLFINIIGRKYHSKKMLENVLRVGKDPDRLSSIGKCYQFN